MCRTLLVLVGDASIALIGVNDELIAVVGGVSSLAGLLSMGLATSGRLNTSPESMEWKCDGGVCRRDGEFEYGVDTPGDCGYGTPSVEAVGDQGVARVCILLWCAEPAGKADDAEDDDDG
jgi:hypothetical protein